MGSKKKTKKKAVKKAVKKKVAKKKAKKTAPRKPKALQNMDTISGPLPAGESNVIAQPPAGAEVATDDFESDIELEDDDLGDEDDMNDDEDFNSEEDEH